LLSESFNLHFLGDDRGAIDKIKTENGFGVIKPEIIAEAVAERGRVSSKILSC
jgi:hypothetical protein